LVTRNVLDDKPTERTAAILYSSSIERHRNEYNTMNR
jgi:hypothetical protein